ncbi:MAG: glycosyltransferase family 2 protein [Steroidobacteraceae bacterium]
MGTAPRSMPSSPHVSVVLPTHNRVALLERAVESVLSQSAADLELIVVNDASQDGTGAYLAALEKRDGRVRAVHTRAALGGAGARNEGLRLCRGEWTAFLDDDDQWLPTKLQHQLELLRANPSAVACSCGYVRCLPSGSSKRVHVLSNATLQQLLEGSALGSASLCICSTRILAEIGGFDSMLKSAQDMDLWIRLRQRGEIVVCREFLVRYQVHLGRRISTEMNSQYAGSRRLYFKHRHLMDETLRRHRMGYSCYIMSRQQARGIRRRFHYLLLALLNSAPRVSVDYARSSALRLIRDSLRK